MLGGGDGGLGGGLRGEELALIGRRDDEAAAEGVRGEWDVGRWGRGVEVQDELVGEGGGVDEGSTFDGQNEAGLDEAVDKVGIAGTEGGRDGFLDGRKTDDDDGLGISEGGRGVEAEVEAFLFGCGDGGDVLVLGGMEAAGDANEIDECSDIGAVVAATGEGGVAGGVDEVRVGAAGEAGDDALGVAVVEEGLVPGLGEAAVLEVYGTFEALVVGLEIEGASEECGVIGEALGLSGWDLAQGSDVLFYAGLLEAGFDEVLGGTNEDAGAGADGGAEGGEVAAGLGCEEEDGLLGFVGDGDGDAFLADVFAPGFDFEEPVVRRRVGGSAEEGDDEEVVDRLGVGHVGVEPELVCGLEVGDVGDGQGFAVAGDADFQFGTGEVEASGVSKGGGAGKERCNETAGEQYSLEELCHHFILDGAGGYPGVWMGVCGDVSELYMGQ